MNFLKNSKIYRVIASILTVVFFLSTINIDLGYGLQAPLGTTVPAMQIDYQVHYNIELLRGIIDLLERNQFGEATTIQEIRSREVLIAKKLTGLELEVTDDEVIVKAAGGNIILRYYNPIQAQAYLNDTVNASHLGLDARLSNNLARQVLYSKSLNQRLLNEAKALPPAIEQESITPPAINAEEKTPVNEVTPKSEEIGSASLEMLIRLCGISFATALYGMGYTITGPVVGVIIVGGLALHKKISFNEIAALLVSAYTLLLPGGVNSAFLSKIETQSHASITQRVDSMGTRFIKTDGTRITNIEKVLGAKAASIGETSLTLPPVPEGWTRASSNPFYAYHKRYERVGQYTKYILEVKNLQTDEVRDIDTMMMPYVAFADIFDVSPGDNPCIIYGRRIDPISHPTDKTDIVRIANPNERLELDMALNSIAFDATNNTVTINGTTVIDLTTLQQLPVVPEGWKATSNPYYAYRVTSSTQGYWIKHTIEVMNLNTQETKVIDHANSPEDYFEGTPDISPGNDPYIVYGRWDHASSGNDHRHTLIVNIADTSKQFWLDIYFQSVEFIPNTNFAIITDIESARYKVDITTGEILSTLPPNLEGWTIATSNPSYAYRLRNYFSATGGDYKSCDLEVMDLNLKKSKRIRTISSLSYGGFEGTIDISPGDDPYIVYGEWSRSWGSDHRSHITVVKNIADIYKAYYLDIYFRSVKFIPNTNFAVITDIKGTKYKVDVTTGKILPILPPAVLQLLFSKGEPLPEYKNSGKYASLPVDKKLSIDDVLALSVATTLIPKGTSAMNIGGTISAYLTENIALLKDMAKDDNPILIRLPLEVLTKSDAELVSAWLNKLNSTPNVYIELYSVESPDIIASEEYYSRHGLAGVYNKRFPIDRTKQNTLTLYAVSADIKKSDLATALQISTSLKNSVVVPIGMQDDATGLVRGTLFGFRLIYIARHKDDVDFIKSTVSNYRDLIVSYGINPPDLKADNILELFGTNIAKIVAVLMSIIRSLPIRPVPTEQMRAVRDHILQSA